MSNTTLIRISNISSQLIPIMINAIDTNKANSNSSVNPEKEGVYQMVAGSEMTVELQRINVGQLNKLQNMGQIKSS
jgi:hypothetical protein